MSIDPEREAPAVAWIGYLGWAVLLFAVGRLLIAACQLIPLASPICDDLDRAGAAFNPGIWPYTVDVYTHWQGRWAGVGLALVFGRLFNFYTAYPWLLVAVQLSMPLAIYNLLSAMFEGRLARGTCVALTIGFMAIHWAGDPSLSDSYYWLTGALENHLSLSMGLVIIAGLIRAGRRAPGWIALTGLAALAVVQPGMHEMYGIYLVGVLAIGTAVAYWTGGAGRHVWTAITLAAAVGLAINIAAPGHAVRLAANAPRHDRQWLVEVARHWRQTALGWATDPKLLLATLLIVCHPKAAAACPDWLHARRGWWVAAGTVFIVGLIVSAALANWWAFQIYMPGRTRSAIYFLFLVAWFITAYAAGTAEFVAARVSPPIWAALACCFAFAALDSTNYQHARDDFASGRAARLHLAVIERDRLIRAALAVGDRNPRVPAFPPMPHCLMSADVMTDPPTPVIGVINFIYCRYYGLDSIGPLPEVASPKRAGGDPWPR
jgi:hypothetical protein